MRALEPASLLGRFPLLIVSVAKLLPEPMIDRRWNIVVEGKAIDEW